MNTTQFLMLTTTLLLLNNANKQTVQATQAVQAAEEISPAGAALIIAMLCVMVGLAISLVHDLARNR